MSTLDINTIEPTSSLRTAPLNGSPSSEDYNDSCREMLTDIVSLCSYINDSILPLINAIDNSALSTLPPIGIEGSTIYTDTNDTGQLFYDASSQKPIVIADSFRIQQGILTGMQTQVTNLGVQVASLQARLASTNQNDISIALQGFSNTLATLNQTTQAMAQQISNLAISEGKLTSARASTGDVTISSQASVTLNWPAAFADNFYTVSLSLEDDTGSGFLSIVSFEYITGGIGITVLVANTDTASNHSGTVQAVARHD